MSDNRVTHENAKAVLSSFCQEADQCGFEAYVITKESPRLRRIILHDSPADSGDEISFKKQIKNMLLEVLAEKYVHPDVEYATAASVADRQHKMYVIPQTEQGYSPFSFLSDTTQDFCEADLQDATGIAFAYRKHGVTLWLYQHLWAVLVPNKKKSHMMARVMHFENNIVFHEQKESLLTISKKIDLVVLDNNIITSNIPLMQKSFGFQDYIRATAERTITRVSERGFVSNPDKLSEYVNRGNGQPRYAKKLMRIADSKVLLMTPGGLLERIASVERWRGMFVVNESNNTIDLQTYVHVERFIDLLDERYTKSEITNTEYDTDVKKEASPVEQETA